MSHAKFLIYVICLLELVIEKSTSSYSYNSKSSNVDQSDSSEKSPFYDSEYHCLSESKENDKSPGFILSSVKLVNTCSYFEKYIYNYRIFQAPSMAFLQRVSAL